MPKLEETSTITSKGQTTVPKAVRQFLGVRGGDQIAFRIEGDQVTVAAVDTEHQDPVIGKFLDLVAADLEKRPAAAKPLSKAFAKRMAALAKRKKVDVDEPIEGEVSF